MLILALIFTATFILSLVALAALAARKTPPPFGGIPYERDDRPDYLKFGNGPYGRKK